MHPCLDVQPVAVLPDLTVHALVAVLRRSTAKARCQGRSDTADIGVLENDRTHLGVRQLQIGDERRQQPGAVSNQNSMCLELEGEDLRQHRADRFRCRDVSGEQLIVGVVAAVHPTVHVQHIECRRASPHGGFHRDPKRVELEPPGTELVCKSRRQGGLARPGRTTDEDQAPVHATIVAVSAWIGTAHMERGMDCLSAGSFGMGWGRRAGVTGGSGRFVGDTGLVGEDDCLGKVAQSELLQQPGDMGLRSGVADEQLVPDLGVRQFVGDQSEHLQLSRREPVKVPWALTPVGAGTATGAVLASERCERPMVAVGVDHAEVTRRIVGLINKVVQNRCVQRTCSVHHRVGVGRDDV